MAQPIPVDQARVAAAGVGEYFAQARECKWGNPVAGNAQGSFYQFVYRTVLAQQGKAIADTVVMGSPKAKVCGSADDKAVQTRTVQQTHEWLTRLAAAISANREPGWGQSMLSLPAKAGSAEQYRLSLETQLIAAYGKDQVKGTFDRAVAETMRDFAIACESRKNTGKSLRACPAIPPAAAAQRPFSLARIEAIEDLAFKIDRDQKKAELGAYGTAYRAINPANPAMRKTTASPCAAGDIVVYPAAPDTAAVAAGTEMTLRAYGQSGNLGRVVASKTSSGGYLLKDSSRVAPSHASSMKATLYAIEFTMCFAGP